MSPVEGAIVNLVLDSPRGVHKVKWVGMTSLVEKSMQFTLAKSLPTVKQYIHCRFLKEPAMTGRVAKGPMILIEYDIRYTSQKAIKGSVLSDYIAPQPVEDYQPMRFEFPDEDISRYRTSVRTSTGATPFSLVYGMETVLPVEVQIPSLRVLMDVKLQGAEWISTRYEELSLIEEKRLAAICHGQWYQQRMKRAFDKKVRPRVYHVGDMVLKRILPPQNVRRGKWTPNYEGPFVVKKVFSGGALLLTTMDGEDFPSPVNADAVKNTSYKETRWTKRIK
ncbi:hypothetical protein KIW84_043713 [Lathyrus oleraceus]|uniref:Uncharacterized protein n=1 Tax=Pisum sativum TaxID=3888 RepID=A0A9D4XIQ9_PEA|nr:hypothetical protein KIW84_043713 [Pisum sativum]